MNKAQALYSFWAGFSIPAIDEQSAYDEGIMKDLGIDYPYISYQSADGEIDAPVTLSADLWYRSTTWADIEAKAAEISEAIGYGGKLVPYDGGKIWIRRGNPISTRMAADGTFDIRRIHLNITAEFLSA